MKFYILELLYSLNSTGKVILKYFTTSKAKIVRPLTDLAEMFTAKKTQISLPLKSEKK